MILLLKNTPTANIAMALACSKSTISQARTILADIGMQESEVTASTPKQLEELFPDKRRGLRQEFLTPDLDKIFDALKVPKKPTLKVLWVKYRRGKHNRTGQCFRLKPPDN